MSSDEEKNYHQKNLEHIERLKERKRQLEQEQILIEQKKQKLRESLRQKVLNEAKRNKKGQEGVEEEEHQQQPSTQQKLNKNLSDNQMMNIYRSRQATFLKKLAESKRDKQRQEQVEKERRSSKLKTEMAQKRNSSDDEQKNQSKREASIKLMEKHKMYLQELQQKKTQEQMQKQRDQEKRDKQRNEIKQQVLAQLQMSTQMKSKEDMIEQYKKENTLKVVRESQREDNEDEDYDYDEEDQTPTKARDKKLRSYPFITDLKQWKKKQRLDDNVRVFIIIGGYPDFKRALLKRGWVENPDPRSPCFDMKFTLQSKDIDYNCLQEYQIVNHYDKNKAITTKVGISKSLRNLIFFNNVDIDTFYPRCYDCNDENDFDDFLEDFKSTKAESILKLYMSFYKQNDHSSIDQIKQQAVVALKVIKRKLRDINQLIDEKNPTEVLVKQKEWEVLSQDEISQSTLAHRKYQDRLRRIEQPKKRKKRTKEKHSKQVDENVEDSESMDHFTTDIKQTLGQLKAKSPQYQLNGWENIWIIKPANSSRGRGIKCYQNLVEILDHIGSKESQWVVQKYIERPIIVMKRKMDIRQWVVVTDWNPLTVWMYDECYVRFSAEDYDASNLDNQMMHLTNNSVTKKSKKDQEIQGNMWFQSQFMDFLREKYEGQDVFKEQILPQMERIVIWSLEAVQDRIESRKNSFEMFGYDFMVDEKLGVWLIEVNSSPAMDYSTHVTEKLVKEGLQELAKVVVDYNYANKQQKSSIDTGKYYCLFRGKTTVEKPNTVGLNLCIEGKAMKK